MIAVDIIVIIFYLGAIYGGYIRGLICELFDLFMLIAGNCITLMTYIYLARFIIKLTKLDFDEIYIIAYFAILIPLCVCIFFIGKYVQKKTFKTFPHSFSQYTGAVLGFTKAHIILFLILMYVANLPMKPEFFTALNRSAMVRWVKAAEPTIKSIVVDYSSPVAIKSEAKKIVEKTTLEPGSEKNDIKAGKKDRKQDRKKPDKKNKKAGKKKGKPDRKRS